MKKRKLMARILVGTIQFIIPIIILCLGVWGLLHLVKIRPSAPKVTREAKPTFVEVKTLHSKQYPVWIPAYGSIQGYHTLELQPQVKGQVVEQNQDLIAGGLIPKNALILKIDPSDYEATVAETAAEVTRAEFELKLEQGNQIVAQREWKLLDTSITTSELGKELALRKPHLQEKEATLEAAKSRLFKAKLDLDRTTIVAPFNSLVISEMVELGQIVTPQIPFATLVGTDEFQVQVSIPVSRLDWIDISMGNQRKGSKARIIHELGEDKQIEREGQVIRLLGNVDPNGRMARLLVSVKDPMGLKQSAGVRQPLLLGSYVRVLIQGPVLKDVFIIPRSSLREGDRVWIKNSENILEFRDVEIIIRDDNFVIVTNNLEDGTQIITSALPVAMEGMLLESESAANGSLAKE